MGAVDHGVDHHRAAGVQQRDRARTGGEHAPEPLIGCRRSLVAHRRGQGVDHGRPVRVPFDHGAVERDAAAQRLHCVAAHVREFRGGREADPGSRIRHVNAGLVVELERGGQVDVRAVRTGGIDACDLNEFLVSARAHGQRVAEQVEAAARELRPSGDHRQFDGGPLAWRVDQAPAGEVDVAADCNWRHVRDWLGVESALGRTWEVGSGRRLIEVVAVTRLVVDDVDDADRVGAECVLRGRVSISAAIRGR